MGILTVHVDLVELWELDVEVGGAELMDLLNGSRGLCTKLVTGEIEYFQTVTAIFLVKCLQLFVLRCESTTSSGTSVMLTGRRKRRT